MTLIKPRLYLMKIVVAMDSFKAGLSAAEACGIVADAVGEYMPTAVVVKKPMADGGEGTAQVMMDASGGRWVPRTVTGPFEDMRVKAGFVWFETDKTAVVEMAAASGLELLARDQLNPMKTTTYGTGELIKKASEYGAEKILLAVGGSATVDGGVGAAEALGFSFLDAKGSPVPPGGRGLFLIETIVRPEGLHLPPVEVLCDVDNPLCGENGAAKVYGPQKGATGRMVDWLDNGLAHLAAIVSEQLGRDIANLPGAAAAGGLAAGAAAFMNAAIVSGIEVVVARSKLGDELKNADWVITGEGRFDTQSLQGKVVSGICRMARKYAVRVAVVAGQVALSAKEYERFGIVDALACRRRGMTVDYAVRNSRALLHDAARGLAERLFIG